MNRESQTISLTMKYQDSFEFGFQLDSSFQRGYMYIPRDNQAAKDLQADLVPDPYNNDFYHGYLDLFRGKSRDDGDEGFTELDHLAFLREINLKTGWETKIGLLVVMHNPKLLKKLNDAIQGQRIKLITSIVDSIGAAPEILSKESFSGYESGLINGYTNDRDRLVKKMADFIPTSDSYKKAEEDIKKVDQIIAAIATVNPPKI